MDLVTPHPELSEPVPALSPGAVPALENGDRLSRAEFERRYEAMPEIKKAELIEGEVFVSSPVRHRQHGKPHLLITSWLGAYLAATPGVDGGDNGTTRLDDSNVFQPDAYLMIEKQQGGRATISADDYVEGAPELVAEIASSSVSIDLGKKLDVYRRNGVREYLVWRVQDQQVDWLVLREGTYAPLSPATSSLLRSEAFPGLWLDVPSLLRGDLATVLARGQEGLNSAEHAAFVTAMRGS
jgi:Uma2 family endonuclease